MQSVLHYQDQTSTAQSDPCMVCCVLFPECVSRLESFSDVLIIEIRTLYMCVKHICTTGPWSVRFFVLHFPIVMLNQ